MCAGRWVFSGCHGNGVEKDILMEIVVTELPVINNKSMVGDIAVVCL